MQYETYENTVARWTLAMGQPVNQPLTCPHLLTLRLNLLEEEMDEVQEAGHAVFMKLAQGERPSTEDIAHLMKELADLQFVLSGFHVTFGLPAREAFNRIARSNFSKLDPTTGKPIYRADGKVLKGPNYEPPSMKGLV